MFKSLVNSLSDDEFKEIVSKSYTINDVAKALGFQNAPGAKSREKIKNRIKELNISLKDINSKPIEYKRVSEYFTSKDVGLVGEKYFEFLCAKFNIVCFKPNGDNLAYDYLIESPSKKMLKIQIKTVEFLKNNRIYLRNKHGNYDRSSGSKEYNENDYDYLCIYSIEKDIMLLLNTKKSSITISTERSKNNQKDKVMYFEDYLFENIISSL